MTCFVRSEALNLDWLRRNQKTVCAELYGGLANSVHAGYTDSRKLGKCTILPSTSTHKKRQFVLFSDVTVATSSVCSNVIGSKIVLLLQTD